MENKNDFRIEKRGNKFFKVRFWDGLSYKQYRIVTPYISIGGIPLFDKNKKRYIRKVFQNNLQDYVVGKEVIGNNKFK